MAYELAMTDKAGPFLRGAVMAGLGVLVLLVTRMVMGDGPHAGVGPRAFPALIGTSLVVLGLVFMMAAWRGSGFPEAARPARRGVLPWILAGLVGGIVIVSRVFRSPRGVLLMTPRALLAPLGANR